MKLYLDDVRTPPEGWTLVSNVKDMMFLTETEKPTHISLDHDLGDTDPDHTGYYFMLWLEREVFCGKYTKENFTVITFHTDNPVGRQNMKRSLENINHMLLIPYPQAIAISVLLK